jgi:hypothetical protein
MFKNSNLHAYNKTRRAFTLTNVPHKQHIHNCHDLHIIKLKTTNPTNNLKMTSHGKHNNKKNITKLTLHCPTMFEDHQGS